MNTLKIIEGQREIPFPVWHPVCDAFFETKDSNIAYNLIKDWHISSIKQILQSEIERKRNRVKTEYYSDRGLHEMNGFNKALDEDIAYLQDLLDSLK